MPTHRCIPRLAFAAAMWIALVSTEAPAHTAQPEQRDTGIAADPAPDPEIFEGRPQPTDPAEIVDLLSSDTCIHAHEALAPLCARLGREPAVFAPIFRERLLRVPASLAEFVGNPDGWTFSDNPMRGPFPEPWYLVPHLHYLGREHAEPILREFFDRTLPLSVEAMELVWEAQDAHTRGAPLDPEESRQRWSLHQRFGSAPAQAVFAARRLHSPMFVDDAVALLKSGRAAERQLGAGMASYVMDFAGQRPDAVEFLHNAAAVLAASEDPKDNAAGRWILQQAAEHKPQQGE